MQASTDQAQQEKHSLAGQVLRAAVGTDKASVDLKSQKRFSKISISPGFLTALKHTARSFEAPKTVATQQRAADRLGQLIKQADSGLQQQIAASVAEVTGWQPAGMPPRLLYSCSCRLLVLCQANLTQLNTQVSVSSGRCSLPQGQGRGTQLPGCIAYGA